MQALHMTPAAAVLYVSSVQNLSEIFIGQSQGHYILHKQFTFYLQTAPCDVLLAANCFLLLVLFFLFVSYLLITFICSLLLTSSAFGPLLLAIVHCDILLAAACYLLFAS